MYFCSLERPGDVRVLRWLRATAVAVIVLAGFAASAQATTFTLSDKNSSVQVDDASQSGMFNWTVNGVNQLAQQWFWFRVGSTGPESSINTLPLLSATASDTNGNGLNDTLFLSYGSTSALQIDVTYSLQGTTAAGSSIGETINIKNNSSSPLDFHFFQYSHFTLGNVAGAETETLLNPNTVRVLGTGNLFSETVVTRAPNHYELGLTPDSPNTLTRLNDANPTTLSDGPTTRGPGDATWAFQWDQSIAPGATFTISKDKSLQLVPEPGTLTLISVGLLGGLAFLRKRR
jgi:hypothetical protein